MIKRKAAWGGALLVAVTSFVLRLAWVLSVPTIVVGDFATYRESAMYLSEHGHLDGGFIYMPGLVVLLAGIDRLGGDVLASKLLGATFGAISAAALYILTAGLASSASPPHGDSHSPHCPNSPALWVFVLYVLWLPGLAMASVVGTDVPSAAMICVALACLCHWGPSRPILAAVSCGMAMGLAAYFRAVALPLVALTSGYWLALRVRFRWVTTRTLLAMMVTLAILSPWALRNLNHNGKLAFTDSHGGVTALMGNDPNTEGTYSRSLNLQFQRLTGKSFLSQPHAQTDRVAYALAKQWITFEPRWTLGMIALRLERLLAAERGLLYWSVYRPGILPAAATHTFNVHRAWLTGLVDAYGCILVVGLCAGVAFALCERNFHVLLPLAFALVLLGTYALFVAEPRYRLTSEVVAFPVMAWGVARLASVASGSSYRSPDTEHAGAIRAWAIRVLQSVRAAQRPLVATACLLILVLLCTFAIGTGGRILRDRYRWAFSVTLIDDEPTATFWRTSRTSTAAYRGPSKIKGTIDGPTILAPLAGEPDSDVEMLLPNAASSLDGQVTFTFRAHLTWSPHRPPSQPQLKASSSASPSTPLPSLTLRAPGSQLTFASATAFAETISGTVPASALRTGKGAERKLLARLRAHHPFSPSVRLSEVTLTSSGK